MTSRCFLTFLWFGTVVTLGLGRAQEQAAPVPRSPATAQAPVATVPTLKIFVLQGQEALNSIQNRLATTPVVEVRDENDQPIEGAEVTFRLPAVGPGGFFPDQQLVKKVTTNAQGQAGAPFTPNLEPGRFNIVVTTTMGTRSGRATITQQNLLTVPEESKVSIRKGRWYTSWKFLAIAGAAAAGTTVALTRRDNAGPGTSSLPLITLTPGTPTVGGTP